MNLEKSKALHERAQKSLVGGVNSPVRSFKRVGASPILAARAQGAYLFDVDANKYVDFVMSYGPHLFGHAHPKISEAIKKASENSTCFGMTSEGELEWAELLLKRLPGSEKVRAMSTGTEACATAIRLARGITKRDLVVKFSGHYHGHVDSLMVDSGSGLATLSETAVADSLGIPEALSQLARVLEFNNVGQLEKLFASEGKKIACLILEPIMGNMGVVPPDPLFLKACREMCTQHQSLLIFDEVMTGLRVHRNSAQGRFGIVPDLTTLGKIIGGGLPLAALAGPAKYMDHLAPLGGVYQAGTLSGNPLSVAAGIAMLKLIDAEDPYPKLEEIGQTIEAQFTEKAKSKKIPIRIERVGSMLSLYFREGAVRNAIDCRAIDEGRFKRFFSAMLEAGFMIPPSPFEAWFLATAHAELSFEKAIDDVFTKIY